MRKIGASGRVSAFVVVAVMLIMIAVPFTAIQFNTEHSEGAPLVEVSYDINGGTGSVPATKKFEKGLDASEVLFDPLPVRAGYVFVGWSLIRDGPVEYGFTTPYNDRFFYGDVDTTLYAKWQEIPATSK
ncbi:MAG: InlB B-repeat-containing protein, partial [Methanomassiliicoccaceae archaeon]|nr:InlB B-repeat-containing protein [Methanomassiliicoccaceae archaeon]